MQLCLGDLAWISLGISDELGDRLGRNRWMHHQLHGQLIITCHLNSSLIASQTTATQETRASRKYRGRPSAGPRSLVGWQLAGHAEKIPPSERLKRGGVSSHRPAVPPPHDTRG